MVERLLLAVVAFALDVPRDQGLTQWRLTRSRVRALQRGVQAFLQVSARPTTHRHALTPAHVCLSSHGCGFDVLTILFLQSWSKFLEGVIGTMDFDTWAAPFYANIICSAKVLCSSPPIEDFSLTSCKKREAAWHDHMRTLPSTSIPVYHVFGPQSHITSLLPGLRLWESMILARKICSECFE